MMRISELAPMLPPLHEYIPPPVAVRLILVVLQVSTVVGGAVMAAVGAVIFCVISILVVLVQVLAAVIVTV